MNNYELIDPWSGGIVSAEEARQNCFDRCGEARTLRYRIKRRWRGLRTGVWEPTAYQLESRGEWVGTL